MTLPTAAPIPAPRPAAPAGRAREAAAGFWLRALFRAAADAPRLVRALRPLVPWGTMALSPKVRRNTFANARRILGDSATAAERRRHGRRVVTSFYDFVCDVGRSVRMSRSQIEGRIESTEGEAAYARARAMGRGAIVVTAHMGSFEVGLAALLRHEGRVHVVFKRDAIGGFEQLRSTLRRNLGVIEAPVDEGWTVWMKLRDALLADEVVVLQGDRVMPGQKGRPVAMLGGHVLLPTGPVKLALASGAPIVPVFSVRTDRGGVRIFIEEPIVVAPDAPDAVGDAMNAVARCIEKYVRTHPEQWLLLDKAFIEDQPNRP